MIPPEVFFKSHNLIASSRSILFFVSQFTKSEKVSGAKPRLKVDIILSESFLSFFR
jgi:hypothetical protein